MAKLASQRSPKATKQAVLLKLQNDTDLSTLVGPVKRKKADNVIDDKIFSFQASKDFVNLNK